MRVVVTGAGGMLAWALVPELRARGHEVLAPDRRALDVTDGAAVREFMESARPDAVVQCAAYTDVDAAEADDAAAAVNVGATRRMAGECHRAGALFVYPSTDYVFAGSASRPYLPEDPVAPINAYGRTKADGEAAAREAGRSLVVRTSWLYGHGGRNFVDNISRLARERESLQVVDDQIGRPTWTGTLARVLTDLLDQARTGTFHATDGGEPVSWYGFALEILRRRGSEVEVRPVGSAAFPRPARRPAYSVLDCGSTERVLGYRMPDWRTSLAAYLAPATEEQ